MKIKGKGKPASVIVLTAFWDTSAIVPLCCFQSQLLKWIEGGGATGRSKATM